MAGQSEAKSRARSKLFDHHKALEVEVMGEKYVIKVPTLKKRMEYLALMEASRTGDKITTSADQVQRVGAAVLFDQLYIADTNERAFAETDRDEFFDNPPSPSMEVLINHAFTSLYMGKETAEALGKGLPKTTTDTSNSSSAKSSDAPPPTA